ncbi:MAG: molybdopterin molybdotransferase MoeA, partial [Parasphingopyxis sp.]
MSALLPVEEARARLLSLADPVSCEQVPIEAAGGRWLAEDMVAKRTQPESDLSAMDGYAIRFADLPGPWRVIGESAAGEPFGQKLSDGEAARIFTGAALPAGADTILVQEEAQRDGDTLRLAGDGPPERRAHIRPAGEDFAAGDTLLAAGAHLTPARIGLLIAAGHGSLPVRRHVRVALISTGNELRLAGEELGPGAIPASNGPMLAALLAGGPVDVHDRGIVGDDLTMLRRTLADAADAADIVVTIGGVSVGDHDLVRPALAEAGAEIDFWRIAMKPGKPLMAGRLAGAVVLGLPGNPVSAYVTA